MVEGSPASHKISEISDSQITEAVRNEVKQLVYGLTYGMGASTLAKKMGCSLEKSRGYLEGLKTRFPGLVCFLPKWPRRADSPPSAQELLLARLQYNEASANMAILYFCKHHFRCGMA